MTNKQHPITPPPELAQTLWNEMRNAHTEDILASYAWDRAIAKAYRAGADQELEACCEWLVQEGYIDAPYRLRIARRPKPPSEADLALTDLEHLLDVAKSSGVFNPPDNIRRCLERLKKLEEATND